jgi:streptogramin lyase
VTPQYLYEVRSYAVGADVANPQAITYDPAGYWYVADADYQVIERIDASTGTVTVIAGDEQHGDGYINDIGTSARFSGPMGAVFVETNNMLYIADMYNNGIRAIDMATLAVTTLAGNEGGNSGLTDGIGTNAALSGPQGLTHDGVGRLFIADTGNLAIRMIVLSNANVTTVAGGLNWGMADGVGSNALFTSPINVAFDPLGYLWIIDHDSYTMRRMNVTTLYVQHVAGQAYINGVANGVGTNAQFYSPYGIAIDRAGNVVVSESDGNCIRLINSISLLVTTIAGRTDNTWGVINGIGTNAQFATPKGLAVDNGGLVYVSENADFRTLRYT